MNKLKAKDDFEMNDEEQFNLQTIIIRVQKKMASKLSSKKLSSLFEITATSKSRPT